MSTIPKEPARSGQATLVQSQLSAFRPPPRIVLAEDDGAMQCMLADALRPIDCEIVKVNDGSQLVDYLTACVRYGSFFRLPDLVLSDVRMPGSNGIEVLAGIRASGWSLPMVIITAFGSERLREDALRLGASAVLEKPFHIDELRALVSGLLSKTDHA